jgi:hypothetical protein
MRQAKSRKKQKKAEKHTKPRKNHTFLLEIGWKKLK